ncbi:hypothetical protein GALMADRAFT_834261 [Galerina marginata CBS 339.88]|uniref:Uncharacterized protein n=1 Tax=Galerina marginata (strain CBS 339.88) TaxID=685588 RepID=A0A067THA8_GALM3|nr:hypothetical protein GALMADRAFT_834261 [Galerina marginata CBS 339.88]
MGSEGSGPRYTDGPLWNCALILSPPLTGMTVLETGCIKPVLQMMLLDVRSVMALGNFSGLDFPVQGEQGNYVVRTWDSDTNPVSLVNSVNGDGILMGRQRMIRPAPANLGGYTPRRQFWRLKSLRGRQRITELLAAYPGNGGPGNQKVLAIGC